MTPRRALAALTLLTALLAACTPTRHPAPPAVDVSAAVIPVALIAAGTLNGVPWQVDLVSVAGRLCTRATVDDRPAGQGCDPPVSPQSPLNIALDAVDPRVLLVYGAADPTVTHLTATPSRPVPLTAPYDGKSFFAYATAPGAASDLTAYDASGREISSAADKIRDFESP
ncbi:hypothetical protein ACIQF6_19380 [Kitasatospora sp. NPDC092948]|uniref:hypothetical protein n=1 Tax=Kitasatospora sp. NPDC092948 TaxID=3364088 RepID=UPI003815DE3A